MSVFAPLTEVQFQSLAMGKARGYTWDMMAEQWDLPMAVIERVPWTHGKIWNRMLTKAERLVAREAIAETVSTLRRDVHLAEPTHHATLANSLTRLLQLQQEYAPQPRRRPGLPPVPKAAPTTAPTVVPPVSTPLPAPAPTTPNVKPPNRPLPSLQETASALVGLFLLLCTLLMGCWHRERSPSVEGVGNEAVACLEKPCEAVLVDDAEHGPETPLVLTPPPWGREPTAPRHGDT